MRNQKNVETEAHGYIGTISRKTLENVRENYDYFLTKTWLQGIGFIFLKCCTSSYCRLL